MLTSKLSFGDALLHGFPLFIEVHDATGPLWRIPLTKCNPRQAKQGRIEYGIPPLTVDTDIVITRVLLTGNIGPPSRPRYEEIMELYKGKTDLRKGQSYHVMDFYLSVT